MPSISDAVLRAFVQKNTRLRPAPEVDEVHLHVADDVMDLCRATGVLFGDPDPPLPYWAFPWVGGLAVARYLVDHPESVAGLRVADVGSGSGLCAIVAMLAGAASAIAVDIDPLAAAAIDLNARANRVRLTVMRRDLLDEPPLDVDVVLAGDISYEEPMAGRMDAWLRRAADAGARVLIGDPGRRHLRADLRAVASYEVAASLELEDRHRKRVSVYTIPGRPS